MPYKRKYNLMIHAYVKLHYTGATVVVAPGYSHAVVNTRLNMKLAFDRIRDSDVIKLPLIHKRIGTRFFRQRNPADYTGWLGLLHNRIIDMLNCKAEELQGRRS